MKYAYLIRSSILDGRAGSHWRSKVVKVVAESWDLAAEAGYHEDYRITDIGRASAYDE